MQQKIDQSFLGFFFFFKQRGRKVVNINYSVNKTVTNLYLDIHCHPNQYIKKNNSLGFLQKADLRRACVQTV